MTYHKKAVEINSKSFNHKDNYRYELEKLIGLKEFMVEARIDKYASKHVPTPLGGYYIKTLLLKDISIAVVDPKDNKLKRIARVHHLWINEEENTVVRDKNNSVDDIVRFVGCVGTYKYSHGGENLNIKQTKKWHFNKTSGHKYKR